MRFHDEIPSTKTEGHHGTEKTDCTEYSTLYTVYLCFMPALLSFMGVFPGVRDGEEVPSGLKTWNDALGKSGKSGGMKNGAWLDR